MNIKSHIVVWKKKKKKKGKKEMKVGFFFCSIQGGVLINKWRNRCFLFYHQGEKKQLPMDKPKFF